MKVTVNCFDTHVNSIALGIFHLGFIFIILGCGVKGDPLPPERPAPLGRGSPSYREATQDLPLQRLDHGKDHREEDHREEDWSEEPGGISKDEQEEESVKRDHPLKKIDPKNKQKQKNRPGEK